MGGVRRVACGNVNPAPEWRECCWPGCMGLAEGGGPPLCQPHINSIVEDHERERIRWLAEGMGEKQAARDREYREFEAKRAAALEKQSQVYYVRIGDHVKIGFTVNLRQRLVALRVSPSALMATEPGGRQMERERHLQFAAERVGRREDFNPSRRLLAHIETIKAEHGEPKMTGWPRVSLDRG
jgi:hypothetical protein